MKLYECNMASDSLTTKIADEIFNSDNAYTGVVFRECVRYLLKWGRIVEISILASIQWERNYLQNDQSGYHCTMTELKRYLNEGCRGSESFATILSENPIGLGFIKEIRQAINELGTENKSCFEVRRFTIKYPVYVQKSCDLRSFGQISGPYLLLESFVLDCIYF